MSVLNVKTSANKVCKTCVSSPWTVQTRIGIFAWECIWTAFCVWTPKPLNAWRIVWLRVFGAKIYGKPFVHQRARIQMPWNLILYDRACVGDRANLYSLARIEIGARSVVAQEAYICTGTHDFNDSMLPLKIEGITIGEDVFVGARAFLLPGVRIESRAIVGACAVVTQDVAAGVIVAGNPAIVRGMRKLATASS